MEKFKPSKENIDNIVRQYYSLKENLDLYRKGMRSEDFKKYSEHDRSVIRNQYGFLKRAMRSSVRYLINYDGADYNLLKHALFCRYMDCSTRWIIVKKLAKEPLIDWL